jgi:hypothetical protein
MDLTDEATQALRMATIGECQGFTGSCDSYIEESAFLKDSILILLLRKDFIVHADQKDIVPFEPLTAVKGTQKDRWASTGCVYMLFLTLFALDETDSDTEL